MPANPLAPPFATAGPEGVPLHAVWYQVLSPRSLLGQHGEVSYDLVETVPTADAAFIRATSIVGAVIIQNACICSRPAPAVQAAATSKILKPN